MTKDRVLIEEGKMRELSEQNTSLNEQEYQDQKVVLESFPQAIFVQMDAPCNQDCLFCSRPETYNHFNLDEFREEYEDIYTPVFSRVNRVNLTGSGELLSLPAARKNLAYFNQFKHAEKMFATNGSTLTPKMLDYIAQSDNRYLLHVSLHTTELNMHRDLVKANTFPVTRDNLGYLRKLRSEGLSNVRVNLVFVATTMNIENLVEFMDFAANYGADGVVVYYYYIYRMDQREFSCYFAQEKTNEMLVRAKEAAENIKRYDGNKLDLQLPPLFGMESEVNDDLCKEAWSQIMINTSGDIISCDVAGDSNENIKGKSDFMDVWNGNYYTTLRKNLIEKKFDCASFCFRANPGKVNEFKSHIITRGKTQEEIDKFLEGA